MGLTGLKSRCQCSPFLLEAQGEVNPMPFPDFRGHLCLLSCGPSHLQSLQHSISRFCLCFCPHISDFFKGLVMTLGPHSSNTVPVSRSLTGHICKVRFVMLGDMFTGTRDLDVDILGTGGHFLACCTGLCSFYQCCYAVINYSGDPRSMADLLCERREFSVCALLSKHPTWHSVQGFRLSLSLSLLV